MPAFTAAQVETLITTMRVSASLSLAGLILTLGDIIRKRHKIGASPSRLVSWWTLSEMLYIPALLAGRAVVPDRSGHFTSLTTRNLCYLQGWLVQYSFLASVLWASAMATNSYLTVVWRVSTRTVVKYESVYHAVAWGVPFILATTPLGVTLVNPSSPDFYGDATLYCWISAAFLPYRITMFYVPVWICIAYCIFVYARVAVVIRNVFEHRDQFMATTNGKSGRSDSASMNTGSASQVGSTLNAAAASASPPLPSAGSSTAAVSPAPASASSPRRSLIVHARSASQSVVAMATSTKHRTSVASGVSGRSTGGMRSHQVRYAIKSSMYIGVFILVYLFATLNRVTGLLDPANPVFVLAALQSAFLPLQGFLNAIVYFSSYWLARPTGTGAAGGGGGGVAVPTVVQTRTQAASDVGTGSMAGSSSGIATTTNHDGSPGLGTGGKRGSTTPMLAPPPTSLTRGVAKSGRTPSSSQLPSTAPSPPTRRASVSFSSSVAQMGAVAGGGSGAGDGSAAVPAAVREGSVFVIAAEASALAVGPPVQD